MSKRKEPSPPATEVPGSKSARSAFEDEVRAVRSEIRTIEERQAKLEEKKANFESEHRSEEHRLIAEYDRMMSELRDKESHFKSKWRREMEPVEKALDKAQDRLDQLWERRTRSSTDENAIRLDKLPPELWEKIFCEFEDADLFPMALSCKFFRQKQKELVAQKEELRMRTILESFKPYRSFSRDYLIFACASALEARDALQADFQGQGRNDPRSRYMMQWTFMTIAFVRKDYKLMKDFGLCEMDHGEYCSTLFEFNYCDWTGEDQNEDFEYLKFLNENRHPESPTWSGWGVNCTQVAAGSGDLELLKYAKENGIPLVPTTLQQKLCYDYSRENPCASAAYGGQLETLKWLRENDCPWYACTCARAARGGHFEILRWALENGCPWDVEECLTWADVFRNEDIRDWIDSTGRTLYADQAV